MIFNPAFSEVIFGTNPVSAAQFKKVLEEKMLLCPSCNSDRFDAQVVTKVTISGAKYSQEFRNLSGTPKNISTKLVQLRCSACGEVLNPLSKDYTSPKYCSWCGKPIVGLRFETEEGNYYHHFCAKIIEAKGKLINE